jgi:hypothetical protein
MKCLIKCIHHGHDNYDDEDVTWEGGKYMTNSRREPCRQLQRKSIINQSINQSLNQSANQSHPIPPTALSAQGSISSG